MMWSPRLSRTMQGTETQTLTLGLPVIDDYLQFVGARCRPNTWIATAYDLLVFFSTVRKQPAEVTTADVFTVLQLQRSGPGTWSWFPPHIEDRSLRRGGHLVPRRSERSIATPPLPDQSRATRSGLDSARGQRAHAGGHRSALSRAAGPQLAASYRGQRRGHTARVHDVSGERRLRGPMCSRCAPAAPGGVQAVAR